MNQVPDHLKSSYYEIRNLSKKTRGEILDVSLVLEYMVDNVVLIYDYKTEKDKNEALAKVYKKDLSVKVDTIFKIYNSNDKFKGKYPNIKNDFDFVIDIRNFLAHSRLIITNDEIEKFDGDAIIYAKYIPVKWFWW
jgi:hypothetical protein